MKSARRVTAVGSAVLMALTVSACSEKEGTRSNAGPGPTGRHVRLIGDGSTADTGPQPNQPEVKRLKPGQRPPQFVVFSWDGAGEGGQRLFSHFRELAKEYDASMTYFLSGVYMLPESKRTLYEPPRHEPGASDIGYLDEDDIRRTLEQLRAAWLDGSEIGTHFNGHFCGPEKGVGTWSAEEWKSEIKQAKSFVSNWKTNTGFTDLEPLPFDYGKELVGGRAPCLLGQKNLIPAAKAMGFRYDASSQGGAQVWPGKIDGIWDFPLQEIPVPGHSFETLSMDYNFLANQSRTVNGDPAKYGAWEKQTREGFLAGFERAYEGNRAPMFIGNHFEQWNGGVYMRAVEDVIKTVCTKDEVRCVSFRQLADWLDAQNPAVLAKLRKLDVGQRPDWEKFLAGDPKVRADEISSAKNASMRASKKVKRAEERAEELAEKADKAAEEAGKAAERADKAAQKAAKAQARAAKADKAAKEAGETLKAAANAEKKADRRVDALAELYEEGGRRPKTHRDATADAKPGGKAAGGEGG